MRSIKREITDIAALIAVALTFAIAWGSPFVGAGAALAQDQAQQQPDQNQSKSSTFTGKVVKNGDGYALRDSSGAIYGLDDPARAQPFEGKTVKVTGQLDAQAKVIHVENIEGEEV
jgi:hypothetical protein